MSVLSNISFNTRISLAAVILVIFSLGATAAVIGVRSRASAEDSAMQLARTSAAETAGALSICIESNFGVANMLADTIRSTISASHHLSRDQVEDAVKGALLESKDLLGISVNMEPNALDGKDAEFAGQRPRFDTTGRFMPYYTLMPDGTVRVEPTMLSDTPGANDWYEIPRKTGRRLFSEPSIYPLNGKDVQIASLVTPIIVGGQFKGVVSADFKLTRLNDILASINIVKGGALALLSNGGMYASHPDSRRNGKKADDLPAQALAAVRAGHRYEYEMDGTLYFIEPLRLQSDVLPWAVRLSFPKSQATAPARDLMIYTALVSAICAVVAALMSVLVLRRLTQPLRSLADAMSQLASGQADLTKRLAVKGNDELAVIGMGFNAFVEKIEQVLLHVRDCSSSVASASAEISHGNTDLSFRTEQQANIMEETAASMEQLTSTVRQNSDNAAQARQLANNASDVATRGGAVVTQVVSTMTAINASSSKVADIIAMIDDIAFQTNILALNAAVEAARAGEQGRGFAVVASEVGNLAQRSASAAKEIKALIGNSVEQVKRGSMLVRDAGATMNDVVASVRDVADIIAEIATASAEQSANINRVTRAIGQMDGVTQQNAALVEEAAAAAESLSRQAAVLVSLVGKFQIGVDVQVDPEASVPPSQVLLPHHH